jgi:hypothetical protein
MTVSKSLSQLWQTAGCRSMQRSKSDRDRGVPRNFQISTVVSLPGDHQSNASKKVQSKFPDIKYVSSRLLAIVSDSHEDSNHWWIDPIHSA